MRQLIKYCLVGASSTVIDKGVQRLVALLFPMLPWYVSQSISFCFGVTNGFFWNRRWTFRAQSFGTSGVQYQKFFATNIVGWVLNLAFTKLFLFLITGKWVFVTNPSINTVQIASLMAIPIVMIWNFGASRLWTFRAPKTADDSKRMAPPLSSPD